MSTDLGIGYRIPPGPATHELIRKLREKDPSREALAVDEVLRSASRTELFAAIAEVHGLPFTPGVLRTANRALIEQFDVHIMKRAFLVPVSMTDDRLTIAISNPYDSSGRDFCAQNYGTHEIVVLMVPTTEIESELERVSGGSHVAQADIDRLESSSQARQQAVFEIGRPLETTDNPENIIPELVRGIFANAVARGASDIHFHTEAERFFYKLRLNGDRGTPALLDNKIRERVDAFMLGLCQIEREEAMKQIGLSGRFSLKHASGRQIDCRYERHRTYRGFHVTIRLLDKSLVEPKLGVGSLAFDDLTMLHIRRALNMSDGIIIMSGPTGSGKSTTLGAMLRELNKDQYNILTLENPVEDEVPGITHCDMKHADEFQLYIKSFMRSDPDIIQMGEIRDLASARLAIEASLTGHQVLTTIHTNSAVEILDRLAQLGIERHDIARTLRLLCAQRLVKLLCKQCRTASTLTASDADIFGFGPEHVGKEIHMHKDGGCAECDNRGYKGRKAVLEVLPIDREACAMITGGATAQELETAIRKKHGLKNLQEYGLAMLLASESDLPAIQDVINLAY